MTVDESKALKKDTRVYWRGNAADSGIITETSWDAVTIAWNNGEVARVHHGDMREIQQTPTKPYAIYRMCHAPMNAVRERGPRLFQVPNLRTTIR